MRAALFAYSRRGCGTARRTAELLAAEEARMFAPERLGEAGFLPLGAPAESFYGELFAWADVLIFVGACGIAVRSIAPHVRDKRVDPAVLCIDERACFVIPLLSGHIGGANRIARRLAAELGAAAAITTATDVNGRFAVDEWAVEHGCVIDDMALARAVSAAVLERDIPLCSALPVSAPLPDGLVCGEAGELGIYIGWDLQTPFARTLRLIPRVLHLGIGCRRGTAESTIDAAISAALHAAGIDRRAICRAASIDLKADEAGLLSYCEKNRLPLAFYSAEELMEVRGEFSSSELVRRVTGVDNVCERAAALSAGGELILKKTAAHGVTVAIAAEKTEVRF